MNKKSPVASFSLHRNLYSLISLVWCEEPPPQLVAYVGELLSIYFILFCFFIFLRKCSFLACKQQGALGTFLPGAQEELPG